MARNLTSGMVTEVTAKSLRPIFLVKFEFDSGNVNFWSGIGDLVWNADTYTGSGDLLSISPAEESQQLKATNANFRLSGIPSSIISLALSEDYQGRMANLWFGMFDASRTIVADPFLHFKGRMDVMQPVLNGDSSTITLSVESVLVDLERPKERRYTDEDHQSANAGDKFFEFVPGLVDKEIVLGAGSHGRADGVE